MNKIKYSLQTKIVYVLEHGYKMFSNVKNSHYFSSLWFAHRYVMTEGFLMFFLYDCNQMAIS